MANVRKQLSEDGIRTLLALKHEDITADWMRDNFAVIDGKPAKYNLTDEFELTVADAEKISLPKIDKDITTTAGRFIVNYFLLGYAEYTKYYSYINEPWNKKVIGKVSAAMCDLLLEQKISGQTFEDFINRQQWIGFAFNSWLNPSLTMDFYKTHPEVQRQLEADIAANKDKIDATDINTCIAVTDRAVAKFKEIVKDSPSSDWQTSGASKNVLAPMVVCRGLYAESKDKNKLHFVKSNLQDGIEKDEIPAYVDIGIGGACSRGVDTQQGGYVRKKFNSAFAHVKLAEPGTDCKTKYGLIVKITKDSKKRIYLRYCEYEGKEYLLDNDNLKLLDGKLVKLRSPMFCTSDDICNKCAGEFYYRMGSRNVGLLASSLAGALLNLALKGFHEATIAAVDIDLDKYARRIK